MKDLMRSSLFLTLVAMTASASSSCWFNVSTVRYDEERVAASSATDRFVSLFNDRKFGEIYEMTDERAKATKSKTGLITILSRLREDNGKLVQLERNDSTASLRDGYVEVTLKFNVKFERTVNHMAFVWYVFNGKAALFAIEVA